jgi:hypothetical protein
MLLNNLIIKILLINIIMYVLIQIYSIVIN